MILSAALTGLVLGLLGSLHCAGMCGPLALALSASGNPGFGFVAGRLANNLGRMITYCLLGGLFGLAGRTVVLAGAQRAISICLGTVLLFGVVSARKLALSRPVVLFVERLKVRMANLLRRRTFSSLIALGMLNGLLPCGLVYVACAGSVATGGLLQGTVYMAGFGLGTIPMMLGIGLSGHLVPISLRLRLVKLIPMTVVVLGSLLILRGLGLSIPYLSPDLASSTSCCHR